MGSSMATTSTAKVDVGSGVRPIERIAHRAVRRPATLRTAQRRGVERLDAIAGQPIQRQHQADRSAGSIGRVVDGDGQVGARSWLGRVQELKLSARSFRVGVEGAGVGVNDMISASDAVGGRARMAAA